MYVYIERERQKALGAEFSCSIDKEAVATLNELDGPFFLYNTKMLCDVLSVLPLKA